MRRGSVGPEGVLVPVLDMDQELCDVENLRQRKVAQISSNRVLDGFGFSLYAPTAIRWSSIWPGSGSRKTYPRPQTVSM